MQTPTIQRVVEFLGFMRGHAPVRVCLAVLLAISVFGGHALAAGPELLRVLPSGNPDGSVRLEVHTANAGPDAVLVFGGQPLRLTPAPSGNGVFWVDVARPEPGFVTVRVRSDGLYSNPATVSIRPSTSARVETLSGRAFFQKVEVTDNGLELDRALMLPIRNARVEVVDRQRVVTVSQTDNDGNFDVLVPSSPGLMTIRVLSRLRLQDLSVLDNTQLNPANILYSISTDIDMRDPDVLNTPLELTDRTRVSGAFNILDVLQRGNELIMSANPRFVPPALTVYWSPRNTNRAGSFLNGFIGKTFFDLTSRAAFILGDRLTNSDEFDDCVLLHEYAHILAARFSRDDSPGGSHGMGDMLDPRVAWSEGWANFFATAVLGSPIYRDSRGPVGALGIRYDLEDNVPVADRPGYRSEASVASLLWDLFDENADAGDAARFPFSALWSAFTALQGNRFVYLPYFLEQFLERNPGFAEPLRTMAQLRSIDFQPGVNPSVTMPFPQIIKVGQPVVNEIDSLSTERTNLAQAAHFLSFTITAPSLVTVSLQIEGLGPGNNPSFNDLDLFLMDSDGNRIFQSDRGLNGQPEWIGALLAPGTYYIEVRSFFSRVESNTPVFNSGRYRLLVQAR